MNGAPAQIVFETERLIVRHYTEGDADDFFLLNADPDVMRYIRPVKSREEIDRFLTEVIEYSKNEPAYGRMAASEKQSGTFIGSFAIIPLEGTIHMQLGYSLLPSFWGKGYATELTKTGLKYIFTQTRLEEIFGVTESGNINSQRVLLKSGFVWHSSVMEGTKELYRFLLLKKDFQRQNFGASPV